MSAMSSSSTTTPTSAGGYQEASQQAQYRHRSGSIGAFFVVMGVIMVLTVLSCICGRVFAAHVEGPDASYDCIEWARRRWSRRRFRSHHVVKEIKAGVVADSEPKLSEGSQLTLAMPQA